MGAHGEITAERPPSNGFQRVPFPPTEFTVGPDEASEFRGCGVAHDVTAGVASLRISGGCSPASRRGHNFTVFVIRGAELDGLIRHLSAIRDEIAASEAHNG